MNLCGVACGRLDGFFEIGFGGCWDVAAGACIVAEAGGAVLDPAGGPFDVMGRRVLGTNPALAPQLAALLAACPLGSREPGPAAR
jgi:inositol-phosphate phosphatase/L-galactose 1-phosphate phosphatase